MLSGEPSDDLLWYRIQLDQVQDLLARHKVTRHDPWYEKVHWDLVTTKLHDLLQRACGDGSADMKELLDAMKPISSRLRRRDSQALGSLVFFPIQITPTELYNGGHRARAMVAQGVLATPGTCLRGDVGVSVEKKQLYPVQ